MRSRGRPSSNTGPRRYPNRLGELRRRLGLTQHAVAQQAGISVAYYGALERGDKRINADTARRLHMPLRCAIGDLLAGGGAVSVPLRFAIAAAEAEARPATYDLPEPQEWLQPGRLEDPVECFAAQIFDGSADVDFPRDTVLFARPVGAPARVPIGAKIVVRFYLEPGNDGPRRTHEILYGILDQNVVGDLVLITRTRNPLIPRHALIRSAPAPRSGLGAGLGERPLVPPARDGTITYAPSPEDPAEILGIVVYAMGPA